MDKFTVIVRCEECGKKLYEWSEVIYGNGVQILIRVHVCDDTEDKDLGAEQ